MVRVRPTFMREQFAKSDFFQGGFFCPVCRERQQTGGERVLELKKKEGQIKEREKREREREIGGLTPMFCSESCGSMCEMFPLALTTKCLRSQWMTVDGVSQGEAVGKQ